MCYFDSFKRYRLYIPTIALGCLLLAIGSLMIAIGASRDITDMWGWGIVLDIFGTALSIYGFFMFCAIFHPTNRGREGWTAEKGNLYRAPFQTGYYPQGQMPQHLPTALALQQEQMHQGQMGQPEEEMQGYPEQQQPQESFSSGGAGGSMEGYPRGYQQADPRAYQQQDPRGYEQQDPRGYEQQDPRGYQQPQGPRSTGGASVGAQGYI